MKKFLLPLILLALLVGCDKQSDNGSRSIEKEFNNRKFLFAHDSIFNTQMTTEERELMTWLYASMPAPDIIDHSGEYHLNNTRIALRARQEMPWGKDVPEDLFRHFVVPHRINNENLDDFRTYYYDTLANRVKNLSMREAALEINHWCHEQATYRPSDARTSSPIATIMMGYGRCGEESVLAAAAMRCVGIPARQVYTPRWAHTDDNHAWIEVYVDGKWWFMGACEPEPVLNLAWFNAPVARAMLLHTNVFGNYKGTEDIISQNKCYTEINVVDGYLPTRRNTVFVVDEKGKPVAGAKVKFKIYNYAEFYTAAEVTANKKGVAQLTTGIGDMLVWATDGNHFGIDKLHSDTLTITLNHKMGDVMSIDFNICPPKEGEIVTDVTPEQIAANKIRLAYEDSIRATHAQFFYNEKTAPNNWGSIMKEVFAKSYANHIIYDKLLMEYEDDMPKLISLLSTLTDKDLRDVSMDVIYDAMNNTPQQDDSHWAEYVLCPRVEGEMLTPHRAQLKTLLGDSATIEQIHTFVNDSIRLIDEYNPRHYCITPAGVGKTRLADQRSRNIFFVALCRAYGYAARIDATTGKTQFLKDNQWVDINFSGDEVKVTFANQGKLQATYEPTEYLPNPTYYRHFTIAKVENCSDKLLEFDEGENTELGAEASWKSMLEQGSNFDEGYYMLTTGTRLANGSVLAHVEFFNIEKDKTTTVPLQMNKENDAIEVLGFINTETPVWLPLGSKEPATLLSATGRGYFIAAIVGDGDEPTNHAVRDFQYLANELIQWNRKVIIMSAKDNDGKKANDKYHTYFDGIGSLACYGADNNQLTAKMITEALNVERYNLPIVIVADSFGRVVFFSQGYNTSLGEQIKTIIKKI